MLDILVFEVLSLVSMLLNIWQLLFDIEEKFELHLVFGVVVSISLLAGYLGRRKNRRWFWLMALLLLLMPWIEQPSLRYALPIFSLLLARYFVSMPEPTHEVDYASRVLLISVGLIGLTILKDNVAAFVLSQAEMPVYLPLMILAMVFFLRSLRHHRTQQSQWRIRRSNIFYLGVIAVTYAISQSQWLRDQLSRLGERIYQLLVSPIIYVIEIITTWWFADPEGIMAEEVATSESAAAAETIEAMGDMMAPEFSGSWLGFVFLGLLVVLTAVFIYRVFFRRWQFRGVSEQSDDIREQMAIRQPRPKRFGRERMPSEPEEQIRYYYRRFLKHMAQARELADTTQDLEQKAAMMGLEAHPMSQIYRKVRYGEATADAELVAQMKRLWRELGR